MQDIVFYVVAKETLGKVRDYSNMRNSGAPLLTLGVAVCLRMRLFDDIEVPTPYPIASFSGITDWKWRMDADFDRSTVCKLAADANGISVHAVTDTVKGETMSFTEFVIPISNMNTEELAAWLGTDKVKTGLVGELVGYDSEGHAAFVLQIENFSVRNRLAGLNDGDVFDPTPVDQEIVTRPVAEQLIQTAVSAKQDKLNSGNAGTGISISNAGVISTENVPQSAVTGLSASFAAKQDKLNSGNAGTGISISNAGVISTENVPQSAVTGLESALSGKQNSLSYGFGIEIDDDWISIARFYTIHGPYSNGSVTLLAGEAYKVYATNSAVTLNKGNTPNNTWGLEGHVEIFVANTGYIHTGSGVVLANALEPDAVNNCTVRFHDGFAIISVEDHVAGYIVVSATGTTAGTLPYALATATQEYVAFDASLNGSTLDMGGVTTNGEKHVVGNGYTETTLTGGVNCSSKTTFSNLSMDDVSVLGGVMTLGDTFVQGEVTAATSNGIAIEKATVTAGGTISNFYLEDGGRLTCSSGGIMQPNKDVYFFPTPVGTGSAVVFISGGTVPNGFGFRVPARGTNRKQPVAFLDGITFYGNAQLLVYQGSITSASHCDFSGTTGYAVDGNTPLEVTLADCSFNSFRLNGGTYNLIGNNRLQGMVAMAAGGGTLNIAEGAVLDMTGNNNATPVGVSSGKLVIANNDPTKSCTIINSGGTSIAVAGGTYTSITNGGVVA